MSIISYTKALPHLRRGSITFPPRCSWWISGWLAIYRDGGVVRLEHGLWNSRGLYADNGPCVRISCSPVGKGNAGKDKDKNNLIFFSVHLT